MDQLKGPLIRSGSVSALFKEGVQICNVLVQQTFYYWVHLYVNATPSGSYWKKDI